MQTFTAPVSGTYKLECWGASGGYDNRAVGKGGYAVGNVTLSKGETLSVYVGGQGVKGTAYLTLNDDGTVKAINDVQTQGITIIKKGSVFANIDTLLAAEHAVKSDYTVYPWSMSGGWNGGGNSSSAWGSSGGGGGATDVRLGGTDLSDRIIVAGGGGGSGNHSAGGDGGGEASTSYACSLGEGPAAQIATQTSGYALGQGQGDADHDCAGAGGGYYGGFTTTKGDDGASGGSGYIGGVKNGSMQTGVNEGDGKVVITRMYPDYLRIILKSSASERALRGDINLWDNYDTHGIGHSANYVYRDNIKLFDVAVGDTFTLDASNTPDDYIPRGFERDPNNRIWTGAFDATGGRFISYKTAITQLDKSMRFNQDCWPIYYPITYDMNGGVNNSSNPADYDILEGVTFAAPTRAGYTFAGWTDEATGKAISGINEGKTIPTGINSPAELDSELATRSIGAVKVKANWKPNTYTIHFAAGAHAIRRPNAMSDITAQYGQDVVLPHFSSTDDPHVYWGSFSRWTMNYDGTGDSFTDGATVSNLTTENGGTVTLYAQGFALDLNVTANGKRHTSFAHVTFDVSEDGGLTWTSYNGDFTETNVSLIGKPIIYRNFQGHDGWQFDKFVALYPQYTELVQNADGSYTQTPHENGLNNVEIYLVAPYTVHFDANAADAAGTMADESFAYDSAKALSANAFTRPHFAFAGWNTKADGSGTSYTDAQSVSNLTAEQNGTVTLYAQWKRTETLVDLNFLTPDGGQPWQTGAAGTLEVSLDGGKTWSGPIWNETQFDRANSWFPVGSTILLRDIKPAYGSKLDRVGVGLDDGVKTTPVTASSDGVWAVTLPSDNPPRELYINVYTALALDVPETGGSGTVARASLAGLALVLLASAGLFRRVQKGFKAR